MSWFWKSQILAVIMGATSARAWELFVWPEWLWWMTMLPVAFGIGYMGSKWDQEDEQGGVE